MALICLSDPSAMVKLILSLKHFVVSLISVAEKNLRSLEAQLAVLQKKVEEHVAMLGDYEGQNKRTASENGMLFTK